MFDSEKFNGFVKDELDNLLFNDIWNYFVFNESDLHSATYYYIRTYFGKRGSASSEDIFVRCEPVMKDFSKPDILIYQKYNPIYVISLKMFTKPNFLNKKAIVDDLKSIKKCMRNYETIRWGFSILVYDTEDMFDYSDYLLRKAGFEKISLITINLRRKEESTRKRKNYDVWRRQFDKFLNRHF